ncbi:type II secretion system F family protein [Leucobacter sp. Z1108]|uniref:type II secretion system F family protein n=1 Tax=unclassified Leucobacter TaxID=2621730 RepID=UPI003D98C5FF
MAESTTLYVYRARNSAGKTVKGRLHAASEAAAVNAVEAQGLIPVWVKDNDSLGLNKDLNIAFLEKKPSLKDLAIASQQLSVMVGSGVTILRALEIVSQQTENQILAKGFADARREVGQGSSLSAAMERRPKVFPLIMVNLVRVGEAGGFLDEALESVAKNFETELKLQQKVKGAMAYPVVVLFVAILSVIAMLVFVVPTFESLFAGFGDELPVPTQILVAMSRSAVVWVPLLAIISIAVAFWYSRNKNEEKVRKVVDTAKVNMPIFGQLFRKVAIARFSRNLAVMLNAGVPMLQAIGLVAKVSSNWVIEQALLEAENSVRHGRPFALPLAQHDVFPPMVTQMVAVGEDSGALDKMLKSIAEFYDREVETAADQLTSLIEPLLIVLVGVVIGGMVVALYLPIFGLVGAIQG